MAPSRAELLLENERLKAEIYRLSLQLQALRKEVFGSRSDKRPKCDDPAQGRLEGLDEGAWGEAPVEEEAAAAKKAPRPERKGRKKGPKPLNPSLPRVEEQVEDPPLAQLICPATGQLMRPAFTETIEVLTRRPAQYLVRRITRRVFTSPAGEAPAYSPWPREVMSKSRIDTSVIANLLAERFADHLPYYRQGIRLARLGVDLAPSTMVSLVRQACDKVKPLYAAIVRSTLAGGYLQVDPTPIPLLTEQKPGSAKQACMWTYRALDGPVFFEFAENKAGATAARTLQGYQGILQTDGATNFGGAPTQTGVIHLNCWAHARRYFVRALEAGESQAGPFVDLIDRLFRAEKLARTFQFDAEKILRLRQRRSLPRLDKLYALARDYARQQILLKTPLPTAIHYLLGHEKALRACFHHVPSRIDNNLAENALRPLKLGAKNWLFVGHPDAGPRAAIMFTLIENCRLARINPESYLHDLLARIDDHPASRIEDLIPQNWAKLQQHTAK